jgi:hypothetical protein
MEDIMTFLSTVTLTNYQAAQDRSPAFVRRQKLVSKIDQQLKLVADPNYRPIKTIWNIGEDGTERLFDKPMRIKRWWVEKVDGTVLLTVRYGSRPLELAKGKNAIELASMEALELTLRNLKLAVLSGELDQVLLGQVSYGGRKAKQDQ